MATYFNFQTELYDVSFLEKYTANFTSINLYTKTIANNHFVHLTARTKFLGISVREQAIIADDLFVSDTFALSTAT